MAAFLKAFTGFFTALVKFKPHFLYFVLFFSWGSAQFLGAARCKEVKMAELEPAAPLWVQPYALHCRDGWAEPILTNFNSKHDLKQLSGDIHEGRD